MIINASKSEESTCSLSEIRVQMSYRVGKTRLWDSMGACLILRKSINYQVIFFGCCCLSLFLYKYIYIYIYIQRDGARNPRPNKLQGRKNKIVGLNGCMSNITKKHKLSSYLLWLLLSFTLSIYIYIYIQGQSQDLELGGRLCY